MSYKLYAYTLVSRCNFPSLCSLREKENRKEEKIYTNLIEDNNIESREDISFIWYDFSLLISP